MAVVAWGAAAACVAPAPVPDDAVSLEAIVTGQQLAGVWEWIHYEVDDGALRREREQWRFVTTDDPRRLVGRYRRDVVVRALDGVPFECNQDTRYHQRADLTVRADVVAAGVAITELGYQAEPGPCDPGLRQLGAYVATVRRDRLLLSWPGGTATLVRAIDAPPAPSPPVATSPAGRWTWHAASWTRSGLVRHEHEDWELAVGADGAIGGSYVREVTVRSPDGADLPCAGAPSYGFVDRYLVRGDRADDRWRIEERAALPGQHPCLADTPARTLDGATLVADGEHVVLAWRGKRRQVLLRPAAE